MMRSSNLKTLAVLVALCAAGWGLYRVFADWGARVPRRTSAATKVLGYPYVADRSTGLYHRRRCQELSPNQTFPPDPADLQGYELKADAEEDGFHPCEVCNP